MRTLIAVLFWVSVARAYTISGGESDTSSSEWWSFQAANCVLTVAQTDWTYSGTDVPAATCVTGGSFVKKGVLAFNDDGAGGTILKPAIERVVLTGQAPTPATSAYVTNGPLTVTLMWYATAITGASRWCAAVICRGNAETDDGLAYDTEVCVNTNVNTTTLQNTLTQITLPTASTDSCAANEILHVKLSRDTENAADTMTGIANLEAVTIAWPRFQ